MRTVQKNIELTGWQEEQPQRRPPDLIAESAACRPSGVLTWKVAHI